DHVSFKPPRATYNDVASQDGWGVTYTPPELCAVRGSAVELLCTYTHPSRIQPRDISNTLWFTEEEHGDPVDLEQDSEYAGRVEYRCSEKRCSLRIKNLRESDSAEYKFMFMTNQPDEKYTGSPGVTLSVTGNFLIHLSIISRLEGSSVTLSCSSDANPAANYTWYKKNQPRPHGEEPHSIQSSDSGQYLCEAENHLGTKRSKFISIDVKYGPRLPSVSVSPSEIVEGSSVTLTCSSDANPAASYTWYKKNQPRPHGEEPQLVFSSIQSSDSRQYLCEAENHLGKKRSEFISIDCIIQIPHVLLLPSVSVSPSEIVEGSSVTLTCSSDANPAASYTWYKKNQPRPHGEEPQLVFSSIQSSDSGQYLCEAENHLGTKRSKFISIDVKCE
uniref:Ig-like domain-containing protein n=1 Tax=Cyclopterus lumpus TaxID=8103 RepID=A0A8C2XH21_CYCLU